MAGVAVTGVGRHGSIGWRARARQRCGVVGSGVGWCASPRGSDQQVLTNNSCERATSPSRLWPLPVLLLLFCLCSSFPRVFLLSNGTRFVSPATIVLVLPSSRPVRVFVLALACHSDSTFKLYVTIDLSTSVHVTTNDAGSHRCGRVR